MSLDKAIKHKKEFRKPYRGSKRWSHSCRNNGTCNYCKSKRTYKNNKRLLKTKELLKILKFKED